MKEGGGLITEIDDGQVKVSIKQGDASPVIQVWMSGEAALHIGKAMVAQAMHLKNHRRSHDSSVS